MLGYVIKSASFAPYTENERLDEQETSEFISSRARSVLSRAARRNVCMQQEMLSTANPWSTMTPRENVTSNRRKRILKRSLVSSAPPTVRHPPRIVIDEASSKRSGENSISDTKLSPEGIQCNSAPASTKPDFLLSNEQWKMDESTLHEKQTPPPQYQMCLTRPKYRPSSKSPTHGGNSRPTTTDWDWVRSRLQSRDSVRRPESSMTFDDFLNGLDLDSDEYDTDLEDLYYDRDEDPYDHTGIWHYQNLCRIKGIAPAQQVLQKLQAKQVQFRLNHRYINNKDAEAIAGGLQHSVFVQEIDLSNNFLNDKGAKHVANMIRNNVRIHRVDLSANCLRRDAGRHIAQMILDNNCLTQLCLRKNKLGDMEALLLAEVLCSNHSLKSLDLSHNQFGDSAGEAFAAALMENTCLTSLDLSWNTLCRRAAAAIARALSTNITLLSLDLSWNGIGDEGAALLGNSLRENSTLRFLSLAVNHICGYGAQQLAVGVTGGVTMLKRKKSKLGKTNCGLEYLNLDRNPLGAQGIKQLLQKFEKSKKLKTLSIKEVLLNEEMAKQIAKIMRIANSNMTLLYEGQDQLEQKNAARRRGVRVLNEALKPRNIQIIDVVKAMDSYGYGINTSDLRNALSELTPSLTELELENAVESLDVDNDDIVHYKNVACYSASPT